MKTGTLLPALRLSISPSRDSVAQGNTWRPVTITETGGFNSPITLSASGLPSGATATFGAFTPIAGGETASLAISDSDTAEEDARTQQ